MKELRKDILSLTQDEFAKKLGVTRFTISNIESGRFNLTDAMARLICKTWDVDYLWLTEGADVPPIIEYPDSSLDLLCKKYNLTPNERSLLESYLKMPPQLREKFIEILNFFYESNNS